MKNYIAIVIINDFEIRTVSFIAENETDAKQQIETVYAGLQKNSFRFSVIEYHPEFFKEIRVDYCYESEKEK